MTLDIDVDMKQHADQKQVVGWNQAATLEKDKETAQKLWMHIAKIQVYLDNELRESDIQLVANNCQYVLGKAIDITAKTIRTCTNSKG
jgi:hypothetical protein